MRGHAVACVPEWPAPGPGPGGVLAAATSRRRALSLDQTVTETATSSIRPRSFLLAAAYGLAYLCVTSARVAIADSFPMPQQRLPISWALFVRH
jgi:hypothetical protein